jgi:hypothetical protein
MPNQEDEYHYTIDDMLLAEPYMCRTWQTIIHSQLQEDAYEFRTIDDMLLAGTDTMIATPIAAPQRQGDNSTQVAEMPGSTASVPAAHEASQRAETETRHGRLDNQVGKFGSNPAEIKNKLAALNESELIRIWFDAS